MQSVSGFSGVYPMTYALFGPDGALSREAMRKQVLAMLDAWRARRRDPRHGDRGE